MKATRLLRTTAVVLTGALLFGGGVAPGQAFAIPEEQEDQTELSADEIAAATAEGEIDLPEIASEDNGIALAANGDYALTRLGEPRVTTPLLRRLFLPIPLQIR